MNLATISMDKAAAVEAFKDYRAAFMAERNRIDGELMRGYKALSEGKQLLRLTETITAGGLDDAGRPRLAIARADERAIEYNIWNGDGSVTFRPSGQSAVRARDRVFEMPRGTLPGIKAASAFEAMVPLIPPRLRPRINIENFHILWESVWTPRARSRAPKDPALLRHLGGDLWAVLAIWDLTDLERAVLEMRGN